MTATPNFLIETKLPGKPWTLAYKRWFFDARDAAEHCATLEQRQIEASPQEENLLVLFRAKRIKPQETLLT